MRKERFFRRKADGVVAIGYGHYVYSDKGTVVRCGNYVEMSPYWEEVFLVDGVFATAQERCCSDCFSPPKSKRYIHTTGMIAVEDGDMFILYENNREIGRVTNWFVVSNTDWRLFSPPVCAPREYREGAFTSDKHLAGCPNTGFPGKDCECCQQRWKRGEELVTTLEDTYHKQYKDSHQGSAAFAHAIGIVKKFINGKKQA